MLGKLIKGIRIILSVLMIVIIIICSIYIVKKLTNKDEPTSIFGYYFFEIQAYSMYPELTYGDLVVVKKPKDDKYEIGMVVTYTASDGTTVTHKIVRFEGEQIICQGVSENNTDEDDPITVDAIFGRKVMVWRNYRGFMTFVKSWKGILIIFLYAFVILEGLPLLYRKLTKENKEAKNDSDIDNLKSEIEDLKSEISDK